MDNNEIKRTNRKALPKFILLFVVCALIGGVIGYFSGKYALNELTGSIKAAGAFFSYTCRAVAHAGSWQS